MVKKKVSDQIDNFSRYENRSESKLENRPDNTIAYNKNKNEEEYKLIPIRKVSNNVNQTANLNMVNLQKHSKSEIPSMELINQYNLNSNEQLQNLQNNANLQLDGNVNDLPSSGYIIDKNIQGLELRLSPAKKIGHMHKNSDITQKNSKLKIENMN